MPDDAIEELRSEKDDGRREGLTAGHASLREALIRCVFLAAARVSLMSERTLCRCLPLREVTAAFRTTDVRWAAGCSKAERSVNFAWAGPLIDISADADTTAAYYRRSRQIPRPLNCR